MGRVYLDHNATAPLRNEARTAMIAALDEVGNPSSVHAEGRTAKLLLERARVQVAELVGSDPREVVFTSGASEAAALALLSGDQGYRCAGIEHDCVRSWCIEDLHVDRLGAVDVPDGVGQCALQLANSETGVLQNLPQGLGFSDVVQAVGKIPFNFADHDMRLVCISAHKLGGPKGVGALIVRGGIDVEAQIKGGGQEMGRRAGTENIAGIAGFGAAANAAKRDLDAGRWEEIEKLRNILENALEAGSNTPIFVGKEVPRLPNTSCLIAPGWKGENQVIKMDLAGFAISAGSACSSGKVRASNVLRSMGFDDDDASCAIRVSLGLETTEEEVLRFCEAWLQKEKKFRARAA